MDAYCVTGSSGFLGSEFVRQLLRSGSKVVGLDKTVSDPSSNQFQYCYFDLLKVDTIRSMALEQRVVIHCAGISDLYEAQQSLIETIQANFIGTIELARQFVDRYGDQDDAFFIYASSVYAVVDSQNFYGLSKFMTEQYLIALFAGVKAKCMIMRFGSIFGGGSGLNNGIRKMIESGIKDGRVVYDGYSDSVRDYIHVSDAVALTLKEIQSPRNNETVVCTVTGGSPRPVSEVANSLTAILGLDQDPIFRNTKNSLNYRLSPASHSYVTLKKLTPEYETRLEEHLVRLIEEMSSQQE